MNQKTHWDGIGKKYDGEIFDVFKSDKLKILPYALKKHANTAHRAIDFGCGMGKAFPYLAPAFNYVLAIDISSELLKIARQSPYKNISCKRADLTSKRLTFPHVDFIYCCNVIMLPEIEKNVALIENAYKALRPSGTAFIVLPSLESIFFSTRRLIDWYKKEGVSPEQIPNAELDILQGIIHIDKVPTKHYSEPGIQVLFGEAKLTLTAVEKLEYHWETEFASPPDWMKATYPWDWLVECKKTK